LHAALTHRRRRAAQNELIHAAAHRHKTQPSTIAALATLWIPRAALSPIDPERARNRVHGDFRG
jgi:hypothetical protein